MAITSRIFGTTVMAIVATASAAARDRESCRVVRHLEDGRTTEGVGRPADFGVSMSASRGAAAAASTGDGASRSSVSLSSSSSDPSRSRAVASSSRTDSVGRVITVTRNKRGCMIVVDERHTGE